MQESSISEKIKELRTDLKMNQKNFSAAIGIRQSTLSSYENGVVTPSNDVLLTIAQKFHVSLDWLFGLSENKVQISNLSEKQKHRNGMPDFAFMEMIRNTL